MVLAHTCSFCIDICSFFVLDSPSLHFAQKCFFSFARLVRSKSHDLSQLFGQIGMVAQIASPHETPNI